MRFRGCLIAVALAVSACDSVSDPESGGGVIVRADENGLVVRNLTGATIYTFAVDRNTAAVINWVRCTDPRTCDGIRPRRSALLPATQIMGWEESKDILLVWWQLQPAPGGGYSPGTSGVMIVRR